MLIMYMVVVLEINISSCLCLPILQSKLANIKLLLTRLPACLPSLFYTPLSLLQPIPHHLTIHTHRYEALHVTSTSPGARTVAPLVSEPRRG